MRPIARLALSTILLSVLALAPGALAGGVAGDQPVPGEWTIPAGETLVAAPGARFHGNGPLVVEGVLEVAGTASDPVLFEVPVIVRHGALVGSHAVFAPAMGAAVDVRGGRLDVERVTFRGGDAGLVAELGEVDVRVDRATFTEVDGSAARLVAEGRIEITRSVFDANEEHVHVALSRDFESRYVLSGNTFTRSTGQDVRILVRMTEFTSARTLVLDGNTFRGDGQSSDDPSYASIWIDGTPPGDAARESIAPFVRSTGNLFKAHGVALSLKKTGYDFASDGDKFVGNGVGVLVEEVDGPRFTRTVFANARWDIQSSYLDSNVVLSGASYSANRVFFLPRDTVESDGSRLPYVAAGAIAAAGAAGAAAVLFTNPGWEVLNRLVLAPLYTRLSRDELVGHEKRQIIIEFVKQTPGTHLRRIASELEMSYGTLTYHVYRLEKEGYLTSKASGAFKRYFPADGALKRQSQDRPLPTELRGVEREIFDYMAANPGCTQSEIAKTLGLSRQALHYHVKKLDTRGFMRKVAQGRETLCYVNDLTGVAEA